jgi:hypothetical protein
MINLSNYQNKEGYICLFCKTFEEDDHIEYLNMNIMIKPDVKGSSKLTGLNAQFRASILGIESSDNICRDLFGISTLDSFPLIDEPKFHELNKKKDTHWTMITNNNLLNSHGTCKKEDNGICKVEVYNDIGLKHPYKQIGVMIKFPITKV